MPNFKNKDPLRYEGISAYNPPELYVESRSPKGSDYNQYSIGAIWINQADNSIHVLMDQNNRTSNWVELYPGVSSQAARDFPCDIGTAVSNNGVVQVVGGNNIYTYGFGNTVEISITDNVTIIGTLTMDALGPGIVQVADNGLFSASRGDDGELLIGATGLNPLWKKLKSSNNTIGITESPHSIDLRVIGGGAGGAITDIDGDSGTATPAAGVIVIAGGDNINTVAASDTVTVNLDKSILQPVTNAAGTEGLYSLGGNDFMHAYGTDNTFLGESSGNRTLTVATAIRNTGIGKQALSTLISSPNNVACGYRSLLVLESGNGKNVSLGSESLIALVSGDNNISIGYSSGSSYTTNESSNICINNVGTITESNKIHIGTQGSGAGQQDGCYVAGIYNTAIGATNHLVSVDDTGKLGLVAAGADGYLLIGATGAAPAWAALTSSDASVTFVRTPNAIDIKAVGGGGGGNVSSLSSDSGNANPVGGVIDIAGGDNINTSAAADTVTVNLDKSISLPATIASGAEGLYSLGGNDFMHAYGTDNAFLGENAGNRALTVATAVRNTGIGKEALRSLVSAQDCTAVGIDSQYSNQSSSYNTSLGSGSLYSLTAGAGLNVAVGYDAMRTATGTTTECTAVGYDALYSANNTTGSTCIGYRAGYLLTGNYNTAIGYQSLWRLTTGTNNIAIGQNAGSSYTGGESNNICIENNGVAGESNVIRIGSGAINCYIAGIYGNSISGNKGIVFVDSNDKLGTSTGSAGQILIGSAAGPATWGNLTSSDASITVNYSSPDIDITLNRGPFANSPSFLAVNSANKANVTGDGTTYSVVNFAEVFDRGNNYNAATGIFTAPVSGVYHFTASVLFNNITIAGNYNDTLEIYSASNIYKVINMALQDGEVSGQVGAVMYLNSGATVKVRCMVDTGGARVIGVGSGQTFFSGYLVQEV